MARRSRPSRSTRAVFIGDSVTVGRGRRTASWLDRLPRPQAAAISTWGTRRRDALASSWSSPRSRLQNVLQNVRIAQSATQRRPSRWAPRRAQLRPQLGRIEDPCTRRRSRREIIFASGVGGRRWGAGGPRMRGARFNLESFYQCR